MLATTLSSSPEREDARSCELTTELILREEPYLRRLARSLARQNADADDLVQETMLRAYAARRQFVAGTSIRAWLTTILRRLFLTARRTEQRRATRTNTDSDDVLSHACAEGGAGDCSEAAANPILSLERIDDDVKHAFERLPHEYRELFTLAAIDGLSCREIATRVSIPVGTVMSRMFRARLQIQAALGNRRIA